MIEDPLPISGAATALGNQGIRKGQILTAAGDDLNKFFIKKGVTTPSLQFCNPDTSLTPTGINGLLEHAFLEVAARLP